MCVSVFFFFFQAEDGIRDATVTGVQTCALPIFPSVEVSLSAPDAVFYAPDLTYRTQDDIILAIDGEKPHWISTNRIGAEVRSEERRVGKERSTRGGWTQ